MRPISLVACLVVASACSSAAPGPPSSGAAPSAGSPSGTSERPIDPSALNGRIAFSAGAPNAEDVYTVSANGSGLVQVTSDPVAEFDPSWAPDGEQIAYRHQATEDWETTEIYVSRVDGSRPKHQPQ